jgi:hypothetical protein
MKTTFWNPRCLPSRFPSQEVGQSGLAVSGWNSYNLFTRAAIANEVKQSPRVL